MTAVPGRYYVAVAFLAFTAGATDAISFLGLGGVFSSVMTANMVLLGLSAAQHSGALAAHTAAALAGYVTGVLIASRALKTDSSAGQPSRITITLAAECVILAGFTVGWEIQGGHPAGWPQLALLATAAMAMGGQSATVISLGIPGISTTFMTGMLTGVLADLVTAPGRDLRFRLVLLALLIGGAVASGFAFTEAPRLAPLVILVPIAGAWLAAARNLCSIT